MNVSYVTRASDWWDAIPHKTTTTSCWTPDYLHDYMNRISRKLDGFYTDLTPVRSTTDCIYGQKKPTKKEDWSKSEEVDEFLDGFEVR